MKPSNPTLNDLEAAFDALSSHGRSFQISRDKWAFFPGGHFQGIQYFDGKPPRLAISSSSRRNAYVVTCSLDDPDQNPSGEVLNVTALSGLPLKHAGGIQSVGEVLAVGVEDDEGQQESQVLFLQLEDGNPVPRLVPHLTISRSGPRRTSTAGAVGMTDQGSRYVLVVGGWDSETMDFYTAAADAFRDKSESFTLAATWKESQADRSGWSDSEFLHYQSLNLLCSQDPSQPGRRLLYLLAFVRRRRTDWADLFRVDLDLPPEKMLVKVNRKHMIARDGVNFSRGAGVWVESPQSIRVYAVSGTSGSAGGGGTIRANVFG